MNKHPQGTQRSWKQELGKWRPHMARLYKAIKPLAFFLPEGNQNRKQTKTGWGWKWSAWALYFIVGWKMPHCLCGIPTGVETPKLGFLYQEHLCSENVRTAIGIWLPTSSCDQRRLTKIRQPDHHLGPGFPESSPPPLRQVGLSVTRTLDTLHTHCLPSFCWFAHWETAGAL